VPGYFDYEQHGFGPVTYSAKDAISLLCAYMENGCVIQREYEDRIESTFKFKDKSNCQRILNEVLKLND
jgi:CDP-glycerol glycerophosphotransferase (TagB/SpsB family)